MNYFGMKAETQKERVMVEHHIDINELDPLFTESARIVVTHKNGSTSLLQRKLKLGYMRAGRIIDQLEGTGVIGSFQGGKPRNVLFLDIESLEKKLYELLKRN